MTNCSPQFEDAFPLIAESLAQEGFGWIPGDKPRFVGRVTENNLEYELEISDIDTSFLKLPVVRLLKRPECLPIQLPHVEKDDKLCYLNRLGVYLDPFDPHRTIKVIVTAIRKLLSTFSDPEQLALEYGFEFSAYWKPKTIAYLTTGEPDAVTRLYEREKFNGERVHELIVASDTDSVSRWCDLRHIIPTESFIDGAAIILDLGAAPIVDLDKEWPPNSFAQFVSWLLEKHPSLEQKLLQKICEHTKRNRRISIILKSKISGPFGVEVSFKKRILDVSSRFSSGKKNGKRKQFKLSAFRSSMISKAMEESFTRLHILDSTSEFIHSRNLRNQTLIDRRIAILGCGTVGSSVAKLLTRAGAGMGDIGRLTLYDSDLLSPSNLGRHALGAKYLNEIKSEALAHYLKTLTHFDLRIESKDSIRPEQLNKLMHYDLIVDATGDETFSTLLAYRMNKLRAEMNGLGPAILHTWVDAGGLAARSLIDDGQGACYRCLKIKNNDGMLIERFPLWKSSADISDNMINQRCGESYFPFSAGVSNTASGIVQQMVLDVMDQSISFRFRQVSFSPQIRLTKDCNPERYESCPCCSKI